MAVATYTLKKWKFPGVFTPALWRGEGSPAVVEEIGAKIFSPSMCASFVKSEDCSLGTAHGDVFPY